MPEGAVMTGSRREGAWDLPPEPEYATKVRTLVRTMLSGWGHPADVNDVELMVSELYANALVHGEPPIELALRVDGPVVGASITDHGPGKPHPEDAASDEENGRGLAIVEALSDRWGVDPVPGGTGKTVWFHLRSGRGRDRD